MRTEYEKIKDLDAYTEQIIRQVEAEGLIKAPAHMKQEILERSERIDYQLAVATRKVSGQMQLFFYSLKVGAAVVAARRGGLSAAFDELNKFFTIAGMPVASSQYWNSIHGRAAGEASQDIEGLQIMRTLAKNMSFLMKSIALGKEAYGIPQREAFTPMNFVR